MSGGELLTLPAPSSVPLLLAPWRPLGSEPGNCPLHPNCNHYPFWILAPRQGWDPGQPEGGRWIS